MKILAIQLFGESEEKKLRSLWAEYQKIEAQMEHLRKEKRNVAKLCAYLG